MHRETVEPVADGAGKVLTDKGLKHLAIERPAVQTHSAIDSFLRLRSKKESLLLVHSLFETWVEVGGCTGA